MDKSQEFIFKNLLTKSFNDPKNDISEGRLTDTLLLLPTDGGSQAKITKHIERKTKISETKMKNVMNKKNATEKNYEQYKQKHYRKINRRSKDTLRDLIWKWKLSTKKAKQLCHEKGITSRDQLYDFLKENNHNLYEDLPKYDVFEPLNQKLWVGYMQDLLNIAYPVQDSTKLTLNGAQALTKLSMADYNGALLRVSKSKNTNLIGKQGVVIWDAQKSFMMITKGALVDELKIVPKKGTVFEFEIPINETEALEYSIIGDRFKYRSADRAGRKFKTRRCDDLLYYVNI
ncbi:hypothetical protein RNJ44_01858 [Nakaseomyces bracarensis]|uniref:Ribonuclease P protein subunit n=1 Tax=Nakaseomyces bracarensis TaxID=273131 RepID=A0ABR4NNZ1_9SACH